MNGSFDNVFIWVTPKVQDGSAWSLNAKQVSYEIDSDNVVTLRIIQRHNAVKVEPSEDTEAPSFDCEVFAVPSAMTPNDPKPEADCDADARRNNAVNDNVCQVDNAKTGSQRVCSWTLVPPGRPSESKKEDAFTPGQEVIESGSQSAKSAYPSSSLSNTSSTQEQHPATYPRRSKRIMENYSSRALKRTSTHTVRESSTLALYVSEAGHPRKRLKPDASAGNDLDRQAVDDGSPRGVKSNRKQRRPILRPNCNVEGCARCAQGRLLLQADKYGPPGRRCVRHGGGVKCGLEGCTKRSVGRVVVASGPGGNDHLPQRRCVQHGGGRRCSVPNCMTFSQGKSRVADQFGPSGLRCMRHGAGTRCSAEGCPNFGVGPSPDGTRVCIRHGGGRRCTVEGCMKFCVGRGAVEPDHFGPPGGRCRGHGGGKGKS
eukprot:GEMP01038409.1.p1 GENE.GEMP01038409.1~~GEMP01038409.1.p1  ORF type:complete len:428 (+),score=71.79 GEMP01038409.1:138-1421(+)